MRSKKKEHQKEKLQLHPRNKHRERYDFKLLIANCPELASFVTLNSYNDESIDFSEPEAVKTLNRALLKHYYSINHWDIPSGYLCPPVPGRADYIHHIADLLSTSNDGTIPTGKAMACLDIGVGANCVYPIIGTKEYSWSFIGTDIDSVAIANANKIIGTNVCLQHAVECRLQTNSNYFFNGIIKKDERVDISICNPPFHSSLEEAQAGTLRKLSNLNKKQITKPTLNFGGKSNELWVTGGEETFVRNMIRESNEFKHSCLWFSSLISKQSSLKSIYETLEKEKALDVKTIPMGQGNKISRIVAWTFLTKQEQNDWANKRWNK